MFSLPYQKAFWKKCFLKKIFSLQTVWQQAKTAGAILFIQKCRVWGASQPLDRALGAEVDMQTGREGVLDWSTETPGEADPPRASTTPSDECRGSERASCGVASSGKKA